MMYILLIFGSRTHIARGFLPFYSLFEFDEKLTEKGKFNENEDKRAIYLKLQAIYMNEIFKTGKKSKKPIDKTEI